MYREMEGDVFFYTWRYNINPITKPSVGLSWRVDVFLRAWDRNTMQMDCDLEPTNSCDSTFRTLASSWAVPHHRCPWALELWDSQGTPLRDLPWGTSLGTNNSLESLPNSLKTPLQDSLVLKTRCRVLCVSSRFRFLDKALLSVQSSHRCWAS